MNQIVNEFHNRITRTKKGWVLKRIRNNFAIDKSEFKKTFKERKELKLLKHHANIMMRKEDSGYTAKTYKWKTIKIIG